MEFLSKIKKKLKKSKYKLFSILAQKDRKFNINQCAYCGYYRNSKSIGFVNVGEQDIPACLVCINDIRCEIIDKVPVILTYHPLNPMAPIHNKLNFKIHNFIERDGTIIQSVRLSAEQHLREHIIMTQILGQFSSWGYINKLQKFEITSRDDPWDYSIKTECGKEFNIEITEFTDSVVYRQMNEEKELEFKKLFSSKKAPHIKIKKAVEYLDLKGIKLPDIKKGENKTIIDNPLFGKDEYRIFLSHSGLMEKNVEMIKKAILKKVQKAHAGKEDTILILDNRSTYFNTYHFEKILEWIHKEKPNIPFKEVFIYTGYYSGDDGKNSEFSSMSLMLDDDISDCVMSSGALENMSDGLVETMTEKKWYGK